MPHHHNLRTLLRRADIKRADRPVDTGNSDNGRPILVPIVRERFGRRTRRGRGAGLARYRRDGRGVDWDLDCQVV
jgi:hypothetical protein